MNNSFTLCSHYQPVTPAKAGVQLLAGLGDYDFSWIPAFAGMTGVGRQCLILTIER